MTCIARAVVLAAAAGMLLSCANEGSTLVVSGAGVHTGEQWVDQAVLHDGSVVEVHRSISFSRNPNYRYDGGSGRNLAFTQALSARDPRTGRTIRWETPLDFNPVSIDFHDGQPYGVMEQASIYGNLKEFGCPEIPYVFVRWDEATHGWKQVRPADFPAALLRANLSAHHGPWMKDGYVQTPEQIAATYAVREKDGGSGAAIPTDFASWKNRGKKRWRVAHTMDGCADTIPSNKDPSHPQVASQPGIPVELEILDVQDYMPPRVLKGSRDGPPAEWTALSFDGDLQKRCRAHLVVLGEDADDPALRYWALFRANEHPRRKVRPDSLVACNDRHLWFSGQSSDSSRVKLLKYTLSGSLVYSIEFTRPAEVTGFWGAFMRPSLREESGYLYFDWCDSAQSGWDRIVRRSTKVRLKEPTSRSPTSG